ncbi:helix-turn-helix domain-containing protein [Amnibacterium sp.]|uniref:helix-turn-helix domain-containing protein n=1 Tax=Amnibacterium sp. TaxID=1872496 RepID=UPI003F7C960F
MRALNPAPDGAPVPLGPRLRATRLAQGITLAQMAEATGFNKGFISRVERDETSPSVATLLALCQALSLPIGSLFEPPEHEVVRFRDAPKINFGGSLADERLLTPRSESRVQLLRSTLEPGASGGKDFYTIACEVEVLHVLEGGITVRFPQHDVELGSGDSLSLAGREPHTWVNASGGRSVVLWTIVPAAWSGSR